MTTIIFAIVIIALMTAIVILYFKPYDYGSDIDIIGVDTTDFENTSDDTQWRSVNIRPGLLACQQAAAIQERVFLARDAPRLPLASCSETDCRCHYVFHGDRRSGLDRREEIDRLGRLLSGKREDRRRSPGRRIGDLAAT